MTQRPSHPWFPAPTTTTSYGCVLSSRSMQRAGCPVATSNSTRARPRPSASRHRRARRRSSPPPPRSRHRVPRGSSPPRVRDRPASRGVDPRPDRGRLPIGRVQDLHRLSLTSWIPRPDRAARNAGSTTGSERGLQQELVQVRLPDARLLDLHHVRRSIGVAISTRSAGVTVRSRVGARTAAPPSTPSAGSTGPTSRFHRRLRRACPPRRDGSLSIVEASYRRAATTPAPELHGQWVSVGPSSTTRGPSARSIAP